ncbi:hypothetical protein GeomeDRAFT_0075 [Geobacter metallireducens RCH3]|nr:hypothetical protein GeomeDRAFT_0075 [Geobacter metallireducens RCH3]
MILTSIEAVEGCLSIDHCHHLPFQDTPVKRQLSTSLNLIAWPILQMNCTQHSAQAKITIDTQFQHVNNNAYSLCKPKKC